MSFKNPFALLADDDGSDVESTPLAKQSKPVQVDAAPPAKGAPKSGSIPNATGRRNIPGVTTVRPQKEANELPASDAPAGSQGQFEGERGRDDRGTGFGRGGARGGRGGARGGAPGGERRGGARSGRGGRSERPDRRSATGITDSAKQEHQSWGGDDGKRELEAETAGVSDAAAEKVDGGEAAAPATDAAAATTPAPAAEITEAAAAPAEEEDNSKTYEEYMKERASANRVGGPLEGRKANEGQDESQWKDGVVINRPSADEENYYVGTQKERAAKNKQRKEKTFLEVEFTAGPRPDRGQRGERGGARGGRGRGEAGRGRGEGRGGRGRGGAAPRGGRPNGASSAGVNVDDSKAFPSLS